MNYTNNSDFIIEGGVKTGRGGGKNFEQKMSFVSKIFHPKTAQIQKWCTHELLEHIIFAHSGLQCMLKIKRIHIYEPPTLWGSWRMISRSLQVPGSPSSALTTR